MRIRRLLPVVLAAFLLMSQGRFSLEAFGSSKGLDLTRDPASSWDARMQMAAAALPSEIRVVGYLRTADLRSQATGPESAEFYLTQYGLAPVVLQDGADHEWIIGNFGSALAEAERKSGLDRMLGSYTLEDLGFGIALIHRLPR